MRLNNTFKSLFRMPQKSGKHKEGEASAQKEPNQYHIDLEENKDNLEPYTPDSLKAKYIRIYPQIKEPKKKGDHLDEMA